MNKAVFLDRDGVINKEVGYIWEKEKFIWKPNVEAAIKLLNENNYLVIVVTNQGGIRKGLYTDLHVNKLHNWINGQLWKKCQAHIDAFYYCPHHNIDECYCRKPNPGMLFQAIEDWHINTHLSYMIGDNSWDQKAAETAEVRYFSIEDQDLYELVLHLLIKQI